jgi:hypothetical protein
MKQRNIRLGVRGVPAVEKVQPLTEVRGMAGAVPDRWRQSLRQVGAVRFC